MLHEQVKIIRSPRRKTVCIYVRTEGHVEVRVPKRFPEKEIEKFLLKNSHWIEKKLAELKEKAVRKKTYVPGEEFFVLGKPTNLCLTPKAKAKILFDGEAFITSVTEADKLKKRLSEWYRIKAKEVFQRRLEYYSEQMDLTPKGLLVKEYSARWGTCFSNGQIALNWRLMMAPIEVVDYVVVHELAHLKYNGHGKRFWGLVGKHLPDYKERIKLLDQWSGELYSL